MSVNKAILLGTVDREPEVRYVDKNLPVANFTLATTENYTYGDKQTTRTEWHRIVAWRQLGEYVETNVHKGTQLYVEGSLRTRTYDKEGHIHYITEIVADTIQLLGPAVSGQ